MIGCAENYPQHIALPHGCLDSAMSLLNDNGIASEIIDE
ncbi:TPA: DNA primase [Escherichia coli]|nr:DNA primase [Escherichia coli]END72964.1 eukaryotic and archaeal DNA primase small subunit domain protein [Escherichia coli P0299483.1]END84864.1 eukaryotic and archaeal DNA primase small subunit domain protein [Escherichia coli P0299483.2]END85957.1 eukaryotic and archaeal DNA primase small subunit domain protein [Escherichia coli P0299483.3]EGO8103231.1 DNA primase [Escherichia coli]